MTDGLSQVLGVFRDRQSKLKLPAEPNMKNIPFQRSVQADY